MPLPARALVRAFLPALILLATLVVPSVASADVTRAQAARTAIAAAGIPRTAPVVVFGEAKPVAAGSLVTESALVVPVQSTGGGDGATGGGSTGGGDDDGGSTGGDGGAEQPGASWDGVRVAAASKLLVAGEASWLFYVDLGPDTQQGHAARVVLVGVRSGRAVRSAVLRFAPLVNGALPTFLRSTDAYAAKSTRVFERDRVASAAPKLAAPDLSPSGASVDQFAAQLGAQRACVVVFGDTFGADGDAAGVDRSADAFEGWFRALATRDPRIAVSRYELRSRVSPTAFLAREVRERSCGHAIVYSAGSMAATGEPAVLLGNRTTKGGKLVHLQELTATGVRTVLDTYWGTQFSLVVDASNANRFRSVVVGSPNLEAFLAPGGASFAFTPDVRVGKRVVKNAGNPAKLLEFTNDLLRGMTVFAQSTSEVVHASDQDVINPESSATSWLLGRAQELGGSFTGRTAGAAKPIVELDVPTTIPGPNPGNQAPAATAASVTVDEDGSVAITLAGTDPNGDALSFAVVNGPSRGALTGSGATRTYAPSANVHGTDSFTFVATDARGLVSAAATVSITITPVDDAVVALADTFSAHEDAGATVAAPGLLANDSDLDGDAIVLDRLNGAAPLTGATTGGGSVTVTGAGAVTYVPAPSANALGGGQTSTDTFTYRASANGASATATATVTVQGANDAPGTLFLSNDTIAENLAAGALVANMASVDPDSSDVVTISLVAGAGDTDNGKFTVVGNQLRTAATLDFEADDTLDIRLQVSDGKGGVDSDTVQIAVTDAADPAVLTLTRPSTPYVEQAPSTSLGLVAAITDEDDIDLEGATARIAAGFESGDALVFVDASGISGVYNTGTGVLTLSGTASLATYETAIESIAFQQASDAPVASKTIAVTLDDGSVASTERSVTLDITPVNDAPTMSTRGAPLAYSEGDGAVPVDDGVLVFDVDDDNIEGATVHLLTGYRTGEDVLAFTNTASITGSFDAGAGTLTLTGTAPKAAYQAALRSVTYNNTSDAPSTAGRTVQFRVYDGALENSGGTRDINITPTNDAPTDASLAGRIDENTAAGVIFASLDAEDPDDPSGTDAYTYSLVSGNGDADNGSFAIAGGFLQVAGPLDYEAGAFTIRVRTTDAGGLWFEKALTVDVRNVNEAPTDIAFAGSTVSEAATVGALISTLSTTDPDASNTFTYALATGPGDADNGSFTIAGNELRLGASLDFETKQTYSVRVGTTDQGGLAYEETITISVTDANEQPTAATLTSNRVRNDQPAGTVVGLLGALDPDSGGSHGYELVSGTGDGQNARYRIDGAVLETNAANLSVGADSILVRVTDQGGRSFDQQLDVVVFSNVAPTDITLSGATVNENVVAGTLVGTLDAIDADVGDVHSYELVAGGGSSDNGSFEIDGDRLEARAGLDFEADADGVLHVRVRASDGSGGAFEKSFAITLGDIDEAPVATDDAVTVTEDDPATAIDVLANDANDALGDMFVSGIVQPANGTVVATGPVAARTGLTFQPHANYCGTVTFTYGVTDGDTATVTVTVTCQNDAPVVTTSGSPASYTENGPAVPVDDSVALSDPDVGELLTGATVSVSTNYIDGQDVLSWIDNDVADGITRTGSSAQTVVLTGTGTALAYRDALRAVRHEVLGDTPATLTRTVTFSATDLAGASATATRNITVVAVNDPTVAVDDSALAVEDGGAVSIFVRDNDTDVDGGMDLITSTSFPGVPHGAVGIAGGGTHLTYTPVLNYCGPDAFTYTLAGGDTAAVTIDVTCVNDAPVANDETIATSAIGNTALVVNAPGDGAMTVNGPQRAATGNLMANDSDPVEGDAISIVAATNVATTNGGKVDIEADGDFVYVSDPADLCAPTSDSFTYTVRDSGPGTPSDTAVATIPLTGCAYYVSNSASGDAGTSTAPFDTLGQAQSVSAPGDSIFVYDGDGSTAGLSNGITLKANQRLVGEAANLFVASVLLHSGDPAKRPTLGRNNADVVTLATGATVTGLELQPTGTGGGIFGTALTNAAPTNISDIVISDGAGISDPALEITASAAATTNVSNLTVNTNGATGVRLNNPGEVAFAPSGTVSITTNAGMALDASQANLGTSQFDNVVVLSSTVGGVQHVSGSGTVTWGDGVGDDVVLTTTGGTAFRTQGGSQSFAAGGNDTITATNGAGINANDLTGTNAWQIDTLTVVGSGVAHGVRLHAASGGTSLGIDGGSISGATSHAVELEGGNGAFDYAGTIGDGIGGSVQSASKTGGAVTFTNTITDGADAGGGINLSNNGGATFAFQGGMTLVTTTSPGFQAVNSGTVTTTGTNNVTSTTGTAVSVTNTTIGAADLTFRSISSNGAPNGIVLNGTGSSGNLVVSGDGAGARNSTGGTIANSTGADGATTGIGVYLNDTDDVLLQRMRIQGSSNFGLRGFDVNNFTMRWSTVDGVHGTNAGIDEGAVYFGRFDQAGLRGTGTFTNNLIEGGLEDNLHLGSNSGTLNATISSNTIGHNNATLGNDGIFIEPYGAGVVANAVIDANTFNGARGDMIDYLTSNGASGDVDVTNNTMHNTHPDITSGGGGMGVRAGSNSSATYLVSGNSIRGAEGAALYVAKGAGNGSFSGRIQNNTIGDAGIAKSGSHFSGILMRYSGGGTNTALITGNAIHQTGEAGIFLASDTTTAAMNSNVTMTNNTVTAMHGFPLAAAYIQIGTLNGAFGGPGPEDAGTFCIDLLGNSLAGAGGPNAVADVYVDRMNTPITTRLPGYGGSQFDFAAVETYLQGRNNGAESALVNNSVAETGNGFVNAGAACAQPA